MSKEALEHLRYPQADNYYFMLTTPAEERGGTRKPVNLQISRNINDFGSDGVDRRSYDSPIIFKCKNGILMPVDQHEDEENTRPHQATKAPISLPIYIDPNATPYGLEYGNLLV